MKPDTRRRLHALNLAFYAEHADEFDSTRDHAWPGWERVLAQLPPRRSPGGSEAPLRLLDVGCGNGRLASFLASRLAQPIDYVGVDASGALLERARARAAALPRVRAEFVRQDFLADDPGAGLPVGPFDAVVLFGVLHHVAGSGARAALLGQAAARLAPGGLLAFTAWRFGESPRLRARIAPWAEETRPGLAPIDPSELEPGDHLLRWGSDGALRYCHGVDPGEIDRLVAGLGLECADRFLSDGRSGDLNEYLVLRAPHPHGTR